MARFLSAVRSWIVELAIYLARSPITVLSHLMARSRASAPSNTPARSFGLVLSAELARSFHSVPSRVPARAGYVVLICKSARSSTTVPSWYAAGSSSTVLAGRLAHSCSTALSSSHDYSSGSASSVGLNLSRERFISGALGSIIMGQFGGPIKCVCVENSGCAICAFSDKI